MSETGKPDANDSGRPEKPKPTTSEEIDSALQSNRNPKGTLHLGSKEKQTAEQNREVERPPIPNVEKMENSTSLQGDAKLQGDANRTMESLPASLFEFVMQFYVTKTTVGEKYKDYFKDLKDDLTSDQKQELQSIAALKDPDYNRTLSLAEFCLEMPGKHNLRVQIMDFVQCVASEAGSLSIVDSGDIFQKWLDEDGVASNKLQKFFDRIDLITNGKNKQGKLKSLSQKQKNNLGCIAAIWLYSRNETTLPQLISHLMKSGMNLQGQAGALVDARAFAFLASMIKSTNKRKFAYFLDYVDRNETALVRSFKDESRKNVMLSSELLSCKNDLEQRENQLSTTTNQLEEMQNKHALLFERSEALKKELEHGLIHHGADIESADSQFNSTLKEILGTLQLAKVAFSRGPDKAHILEYQLDEIEQLLHKELK